MVSVCSKLLKTTNLPLNTAVYRQVWPNKGDNAVFRQDEDLSAAGLMKNNRSHRTKWGLRWAKKPIRHKSALRSVFMLPSTHLLCPGYAARCQDGVLKSSSEVEGAEQMCLLSCLHRSLKPAVSSHNVPLKGLIGHRKLHLLPELSIFW